VHETRRQAPQLSRPIAIASRIETTRAMSIRVMTFSSTSWLRDSATRRSGAIPGVSTATM
jgi:hypothetical protein